ncbi:hypothetical protein BJY00DRAFT_315230 [Aspergillus carlsbadensis]|nr:hypothetical protein BJY00DRAFT_315230 [Aspergillus carlsbadensis]
MSANPSIIFYQGRRCTKVPRQPRATDPPSTTNDPATTSTDHDSPEETAAPEPASSAASTTVAPEPTSSASDSDPYSDSSSSQTQDQISSAPSEPHSSDSDNLYGTAPTDTSISHTTFTTSTSTSSETSTSLSEPNKSPSDDDGSGPPFATIFGVLFGVLGFIALIIILFFFFRRRSRRNSTSSEPGGWSVQKLLPSGRGTPDSTTTLQQDYRPPMSCLADATPGPSTLYKTGTAPPSYFDEPASTQTRSYQTGDQAQNPFSDSAEITHFAQSSIVPFMMRSSAMEPDSNRNSDPTRPAESYAPYRDRDLDRDSMQSGTSLGSTLVLPGRSSAGSNYQGMLFPKPPETGLSFQRDSVRGYVNNGNGTPNMQSDMSMYDVDVDRDRDRPPISASRRSSGAIPLALI